MSLSGSWLVSVFDAKVEEVLSVLDGLVQVTLIFIDHTDFLVTLRLLLSIVRSL